MRICAIHGSSRKGNTDRTIDIIKEQLSSFEEVEYFGIYLPQDLPHFCSGCFACLSTGDYAGQNCPHKQFTHPIMEKMLRSDGIIIASPAYALAETAQVKAFLDHYACCYINHRPHEEMFSKVGFVISTAAGAGTGRVVSTISRNMLFWGIKRIVKCKINVWAGAANWDDMPVKRRLRAEKLLKRKASYFYKLTKNRHHINSSLSSKGLFFVMKQVVASFPNTSPDKIYWKSKGWL